ncbi:hypothetical protein QRX50_49325 [Amycolatopsis carbonis]|uniref:Uncharacterized protein n=1 Tax=Amycolatopsis carbonis TaxID=715471 RepID=A0A9Y2IF53_9PSEU|nr:hypothetical protein [Amycolatopsis sp. 2-15]WIX79235.1 hypothetical protein QRX50_49325 [Amycolatopsis sp. 2-15]
MMWTLGGRSRVRAVAAVVCLAVLVCVLMSHSPAATSATESPAHAMPTMAVPSSADAVVDPVLADAAVALPGAMTDCGGMGGSGAAHGCLAAVSALVPVALAVVLATVAGRWIRWASPVSGPTGYVVAARGAPPWTVLTRSQLSVIRV